MDKPLSIYYYFAGASQKGIKRPLGSFVCHSKGKKKHFFAIWLVFLVLLSDS